MKTTLRIILPLALVLLSAAPAAAAGKTSAKEMQAREAFAAGQYQTALDLFVKLYAESLHPNYLRNIGRCYQNLGDPDKAISSFKEYLRKAKNLPSDEKQEVESFIKEMEELKAQREAAAKPPEPMPPPVQPVPPPPVTPVAPPPPDPTTVHAVDLTPKPQPAPATEASPIYKRWWFWAGIGVVAVGLGALAATTVFAGKEDANCPTGVICQ